MVTPAAKRQAVAHACAVHGVSERRACKVLGVDRSSVRYRGRRGYDAVVRLCIRGLAAQRRRFGYRRLHLLLTREGHHMNQKRFRRLYREEKLLFHLDEGRCRCASGAHGHAPGQCRNDATRSGGLCGSCFEHVADRFQDTH